MDLQNKDQLAGRIRQRIFEPVMFGRYCLIDQISKGGMSDIYLAKCSGAKGFQKPLVIKKLLPKYATKPSFVKRFVNEARTLARLNHSNVVQVLDMGIIDEEYYIALEYIEGRNVAHVISKATKTGRFPSEGFVLHVVMELAKGLAYAHRKKGESGEDLMLVHQDINSFNVMVSYEAEVKIIDFGIAQIFLDKQNTDGMPVAGKLLYFSPEQLQRKPVDRRVDIYGTGVLMYELLTGERLVDHQETVNDTVKAILETDVNEKVRNNDKIHKELKPIVAKAISFDPNDRYSWIEEMARDLRKAIKKCEFRIIPDEFSAYMREQFHREILLDRRRMRKLASERLPAKVSAAIKRATATSTGRLAKPGSLSALALMPSSWPFEEQGESADEEVHVTPQTLDFASGQQIFRQGDPGTDIYVIRKGRVRIYLNAGEARQTLSVLNEGEFFGESGEADDLYRGVSAVAEDDCELICLDRETFSGLIDQDLARRIVFSLMQKLRESRLLIEASLLEDSLARLIFGLMYLQKRGGLQNGKEIDLRELKEMFRLQDSEQIRKYLAKLESLNIVQSGEDVVHVRNAETLENILNILLGHGKFVLKL